MRHVTIDSHHYQVPSRWSELTADQLEGLATLVATGHHSTRLRAAYALLVTGLRVKRIENEGLQVGFLVKPRRGKELWLSTTDAKTLYDLADFLFSTPTDRLPTSQLYKYPCPLENLHDVGEGLSNVTFGNFLHYLTLRAKSQPFQQFLTPIFGENVQKQKPKRLLALTWLVDGCSAHLAKLFPDVLGVKTQDYKTPRMDVEQDDPFKLIYAVAERITDIDTVRESNLWDALYFLQTKVEQNRNHYNSIV